MYSRALALMTLLTAGCIASAGTDMSAQSINQWEEKNCSRELMIQFAFYLVTTVAPEQDLPKPPDIDKCCETTKCKNEKDCYEKKNGVKGDGCISQYMTWMTYYSSKEAEGFRNFDDGKVDMPPPVNFRCAPHKCNSYAECKTISDQYRVGTRRANPQDNPHASELCFAEFGLWSNYYKKIESEKNPGKEGSI